MIKETEDKNKWRYFLGNEIKRRVNEFHKSITKEIKKI